MSRTAKFFLLVVAPVLAILLALLGVGTLQSNPLGWFLLLTGVAYAAGVGFVYWIRKGRFWESSVSGATTQEEHGDRSYWLITAGMQAVFYLSPVEYLNLAARLPRTHWMSSSSVGLVMLGTMLFLWARHTLRTNYSGHVSVKSGQTLVQSGPYRLLRHPAYAGYLLMAFGTGLGYSSLAGVAAIPLLLLPGLIYRMKLEDDLLAKHFGETHRLYMRRTKRLIPGIW